MYQANSNTYLTASVSIIEPLAYHVNVLIERKDALGNIVNSYSNTLTTRNGDSGKLVLTETPDPFQVCNEVVVVNTPTGFTDFATALPDGCATSTTAVETYMREQNRLPPVYA